MEIEYISLKEFLDRKSYLQKGDYLYKHDKNEHPLNKEFDLSNLSFVIENNGHELQIQNMANREIKDVDLSSTTDFWWVRPLPYVIRRQIGLV